MDLCLGNFAFSFRRNSVIRLVVLPFMSTQFKKNRYCAKAGSCHALKSGCGFPCKKEFKKRIWNFGSMLNCFNFDHQLILKCIFLLEKSISKPNTVLHA